jgi:lysophospholipase L1-like esterase
MDKKILFTNGCSWTWGGALDEYWETEQDRLTLVWPHHLGKLLNSDEVINYSIACGSNQRIMRTTIDWLTSKTKEELKNSIAIIQWTELSRYEYYVAKNQNDQIENIHDRWLLNKSDCVVTSWDVTDNYHKNKTVFFMDDVKRRGQKVELTGNDFKYNNEKLKRYSNIEAVYSLTSYCETLSSLFNKLGVKYYFWEFLKADNLFNEMPDHIKNLHKTYNWITVTDYEKLSQSPIVSDKNKNDAHPSLVGHTQIAKIIYDKIKAQTIHNLFKI